MNRSHAKWICYIQEFTLFLKHKFGAQNKGANSLSRIVSLLATL